MAAQGGGRSYVYLIKDGETPIYVGKGTGRRAAHSARKHGGEVVYLERDLTDDQAFNRERHWIAELQPVENKCLGGNGGRCRPKAAPQKCKVMREIERVGSRVYAARFLLTKLSEANCERWGVSKVELSRLREVAHG